MLPPKPAKSGIKIAVIGNTASVESNLFATNTAKNSPIKVIKSQGVLARTELKTLPDNISSSSKTSVAIPDDV